MLKLLIFTVLIVAVITQSAPSIREQGSGTPARRVTRQLPPSPGGGMSPQFDPSQMAQGMSDFADPAKMANKVADGIQKMQQMTPMG